MVSIGHNHAASRLSRHVAALEARLGVRLVNRSTRRFVVTEVGHEVHKHAVAMLSEADAAVEAVEFARADPCGVIKASCPVAFAQGPMAEYLPDFLARYPKIRLMLHATNRPGDVINEGLDVALRVRTVLVSFSVSHPPRPAPIRTAFIDFLAQRMPRML